MTSVPSLNQPESRLPSALANAAEHDFDGGKAAVVGFEELIARRSVPSHLGGFGGLMEQPARAEARASATTRAVARRTICLFMAFMTG